MSDPVDPTRPYGQKRAARPTPAVMAGVPDTVPNPVRSGPGRIGPHRYPSSASATVPHAAGPGIRLRGYLLLGLCALLLVGGRVLHDSWRALQAGDAALATGDRVAATREYLHAVRMYLPASPFVSRALDNLESVARSAAAAGDAQGERQALEAVRAGLLGARSVYTPHAGRLVAANRRLASLYARLEDESVAPGASLAQRESWHAGRLAAVPGPAVAPTLAALLGLGLWLAAVVTFVRRGVDRSLRLHRPWAMLCAVGFFVGFVVFVVGLRLA